MGVPDNAAIADTVAAVFRDRAYVDVRPPSLWEMFWRWLARVLGTVFEHAATTPTIGRILLWGLGIVAALLIVRIGYALYQRYGGTHATHESGAVHPMRNLWDTAQQLAAKGDHTGAAHALYLALLSTSARRGYVTLDDSKTIGDYRRELRARSAPTLPTFIDFTRTYETVVYGIGYCDAERYGRLHAIVAPLFKKAA